MNLNFTLFAKDFRRRKANTALFYNVGGTLIPFIIVTLVFSLYSQFEKIIYVVDRGDFCIYSVGLYTTSLFLFNENKESIRNKFDYWTHNFIIYFIIIAAVVYGGVYTKDLVLKELDLNILMVRIVSLTLFSFSIITIYRGLLLEYKTAVPKFDVDKERRGGVEEILKDL